MNSIFLGIILPFCGTVLGSLCVFFMKNSMNAKLQKLLLGFASGVMIAASVWSLLIPSIDMAKQNGGIVFLPAAIGFVIGVFFLILLDIVIPNLFLGNNKKGKLDLKLKKTTMLFLAVTLHNIPEGMAVGIAFAGVLLQNTGITITGAYILALGIAIQNFPEGAIISMPLKSEGMSKKKAFLYGTVSAVVELISAIATIVISNIVVPILPYFLSFAAGAMIYVVIEELVPECHLGTKSKIGILGLTFGFVLMMILDVALG